MEFSTYYGGTNDDYDPVGERGIKFNDCRIYTIVTAQSNNIPLTQGSLNTTKTSPTSRYEPGLVVWANPPDLLGNTINYLGTAICAGSVPGDITAATELHAADHRAQQHAIGLPVLRSGGHLQWQISTDSRELDRHRGFHGPEPYRCRDRGIEPEDLHPPHHRG